MLDIKNIDLEKVNMFALRTIARQIGVQSPTVMKKKELIEAIKKVTELGGEQTETRKVRSGRPCLKTLDVEAIIDFSPINFTEKFIKDYSKKFNLVFDEYVFKMEQMKDRYLKKLLKISKSITENPPK